MQVSELYCYPIKSLGGICLNKVEITDKGFKYDRRWMLIDENNRFLSQRAFAIMALLKVAITKNGLVVTNSKTLDSIVIPFEPETNEFCVATVWDEPLDAIYVGKKN